MASIRKIEKDGKVVGWQATVSCGRDAQGKQIRRFVTRSTEKECKSAARQLEQEYEDGKLSNVPNMKFSAWADKYLEIKKPELSPTTYRFYKGCINKHFKPYFIRLKLHQINDLYIRQYVAKSLEDKSKSKLTVKKHLAVLSSILGMALKQKNPCIGVEISNAKGEVRYVPTTEEFERLLNAVEGMWDEIPILLASWCGMRLGEIFCLKVNDITGDKIRIDENRALSEDGYVEKDPKSENGKRVVAVPDYIMELINSRISEFKLKDDDYIFNMRPDSYGKRFAKLIMYHNLMLTNKPTGRQAPFHDDSIPRMLKIQSKPIPDFTFHALRHYHATVLYEQHIPDLYAAQRLGHDIMVLKRIYQRLRLKEKTSLDDTIKDIFKKPE
jgi:integrase